MRGKRIVLWVLLGWPALAYAEPEEEALAAFEQFFASFTAASADEVAGLFAPDALFYGTGSQEVVTEPAGVRQYFVNTFGTPAREPGVVRASSSSSAALVLSDTVVLVSGMWHIERMDGDQLVQSAPMRVSVTFQKRGDQWLIVQFHNSLRPNPAPR